MLWGPAAPRTCVLQWEAFVEYELASRLSAAHAPNCWDVVFHPALAALVQVRDLDGFLREYRNATVCANLSWALGAHLSIS